MKGRKRERKRGMAEKKLKKHETKIMLSKGRGQHQIPYLPLLHICIVFFFLPETRVSLHSPPSVNTFPTTLPLYIHISSFLLLVKQGTSPVSCTHPHYTRTYKHTGRPPPRPSSLVLILRNSLPSFRRYSLYSSSSLPRFRISYFDRF